MPDLRIVLRPIQTGDKVLQSGEVVDVSGWRNSLKLERMGRISKEQATEPAPKRKAPAKRTVKTNTTTTLEKE